MTSSGLAPFRSHTLSAASISRELARQMGMPVSAAEQLIASHRAAFPRFWSWSDAVESHALLHGEQTTVFGWRLAVDADANPRGLRNFPMQAARSARR